MFSENPRKPIAFACPACLSEFRFYAWEIEALDGKVPKCDFCMIPLERIREGR
jgi:hypothetical protein